MAVVRRIARHRRAPKSVVALACGASVVIGAAVIPGSTATVPATLSAASVTAPPAAPPPAPPPQAEIGALFIGPANDPGGHFCTATVVTSSSGDLVMTAGHCVADGDGTPVRTGMSFAPGYHDGVAPYGYWTVTAAAVDTSWVTGGDPDDDVAFLTVSRPGSPPVQQITGADDVDFGGGAANTTVTVVGYNATDERTTTTSATATAWSAGQLRLNAPGLSDGSSGGPWFVGADDGRVVGVTGGYQQGGISPDVSYSAVLGSDAESLYTSFGGTTD